MTNQSPPFRTHLVRPREGRVIVGVRAGLRRAYGWDPRHIVRIVLFCLIALCGAGTPYHVCVVAWTGMPNALLKQTIRKRMTRPIRGEFPALVLSSIPVFCDKPSPLCAASG